MSSNSASQGGGAYFSTLNNCTVIGNSAGFGGGVSYAKLYNCIVYFNTAPNDAANWDYYSEFSYCCTTPFPPRGVVGNIWNPPLFVNLAGGNLRLQSNSPCINSGLNAYAPAGPDLDGNPRIAGGTVDIGAYEFQLPASAISYAWLQQYGLTPDAAVDAADSDGDGPNNWQEWIAGTVPTDAVSALRMLNSTHDASGLTVSWQSVGNRTYFLERATHLGSAPPFSLLTGNLTSQGGTTSYEDTSATGPGPFFYRVGVQP